MNARPALLSAAILALTLPGGAAAQSVVELRRDARVVEGRPVRLGDVARITGADADSLADIALLDAVPAGSQGVSIAQVRRSIVEAKAADLSSLTLRGSTCSLLVSAASPPAPVVPPPAAEPAEGEGRESPAAEPAGGRVREAVVAKLGQVLGVEEADLRVEFDAQDADLLAMAAAGRTVEVRPVGSSERVPIAVTVYEGGRILASRTIRAGVLVRREVAVATGAKRRGEVIGPGDITTDVQWLGPNARPAAAAAVVGAAVRSRLQAGEIVGEGEIEAAVIVRKGEIVSIHCPSGTVVIRTTGRALADGRDGEVVEFEPVDRPDRRGARRAYFARMSGPGRAVVVTGAEQLP